jgi:hypothetical protein
MEAPRKLPFWTLTETLAAPACDKSTIEHVVAIVALGNNQNQSFPSFDSGP